MARPRRLRVLQALVELSQPQLLTELLEHNLDEDSGRGRGVLLCQPDGCQDRPWQGLGRQEVRKKLGDIAELVRLEAVHRLVLARETLLKALPVLMPEEAEPLAKEAEVAHVAPFLAAALQDHGA